MKKKEIEIELQLLKDKTGIDLKVDLIKGVIIKYIKNNVK